jgi:pimeloyl-ACP methyl ester carboxylesterase
VDAAADVAAIADELGIERFAVVGRSGGGPHALACAAELPGRVTRAAVLVGLAPANAPDLDWFDGMNGSNVAQYMAAESDLSSFMGELTTRAARTRRDPETIVQILRPKLSKPDRHVVDDVVIRRLLADTYAEALRNGADGWIDDALALRSDWGFDVSSIDVPVRIWHGEEDSFSPVDHAHWLKERIPNAEINIEPGKAHFGAVEILPNMLIWLTGPTQEGSENEHWSAADSKCSERVRVEDPMHQPPFAQRYDTRMAVTDQSSEPLDHANGVGHTGLTQLAHDKRQVGLAS